MSRSGADDRKDPVPWCSANQKRWWPDSSRPRPRTTRSSRVWRTSPPSKRGTCPRALRRVPMTSPDLVLGGGGDGTGGGGSFRPGPAPGDKHPSPDRSDPDWGRTFRVRTAFCCRWLRLGRSHPGWKYVPGTKRGPQDGWRPAHAAGPCGRWYGESRRCGESRWAHAARADRCRHDTTRDKVHLLKHRTNFSCAYGPRILRLARRSRPAPALHRSPQACTGSHQLAPRFA